MSVQTKYDALRREVRERSDDLVLLRIVGPSEEELRAAQVRLDQQDVLSPACNWGKKVPLTRLEILARAQWHEIGEVQAAYEARYC